MGCSFIEIPIDGTRDECLARESQRSGDLFGRKIHFEKIYDGTKKGAMQCTDALHRIHALHVLPSSHLAHVVSAPAAILFDMAVDRTRILAERAGNIDARVSGPQHASNDRPILPSDVSV